MRTLALILMACLAAVPAVADAPRMEEIRKMTSESRTVAEAALGTLAKLVNENTAQRMGFDTPAQVRDARLGSPLADYMVGLEPLQNYSQNQDPNSIIEPTGLMYYPVVGGEMTRCSITVAGKGGEWKPVSFGSPMFSRALTDARDKSGGRMSEVFALRVPALNLVFVGHRQENEVLLTTAAAHGQFGLEDGSTAPAREIFRRLQVEAERHDGLPR